MGVSVEPYSQENPRPPVSCKCFTVLFFYTGNDLHCVLSLLGQSFRHLENCARYPRPLGYAADLYIGSGVVTENNYNDSAVKTAAKARKTAKRRGSLPENSYAAKVTWLQAGSAAGPSRETGPTREDATRSDNLEPPLDTSGPPGGELMLLTNHPEESPESRASAPRVIPRQRPKVATKKELASYRPPPSPTIQLPLGEWHCGDSRSGGL